ncbi:Cytochrome P450 [Photobacterium marinum]|uniref:Cytochrome P450 n=1 Tax=Photobacterium marinum TaxID=1056511 RepID=L8J9S9_9GAMM|nr:cytochrome P450 [Photobacterium marinum]ELR64269.1 Cytochrome P450 [Photobacterium marinum]
MTESVIRSNKETKRTLEDLPQPKGWPLLGNFPQINNTKLHQILEQWSREFGDTFKFSIAGKEYVVISDPAAVKDLLRRRPKSINRTSNLEKVFKELGIHGVLSANGESWKRQRKLIMPAFSKKSLTSFFPLLEQTTSRLQQRLIKRTADNHDIAIHDDLRRFTVDITTSLVFGHDTCLLEHDGDGLQKDLEVIFPQLNRRTKMPFPYWHYFKMKQDHELDRSLVKVKTYALDIVDQIRDELEKNSQLAEAPENILQAMVAASDDDNDRLTNEELFANILTLLLAGEDTTSNLIAWMLFFLSQKPDVQDKINAEANKIRMQNEGKTTVEGLDQLKYLEAVARETLRLKSTVPMISGETVDQMTLPDGTELPAGTGLFMLTRLGGMDETIFTGAEQFNPERWLEAAMTTEACPHKANNQFPFGGGARHCPGEGLAFMEVKMVIAMICQHFTIGLPTNPPVVEEEFAITMRPKNLVIKLIPR